MGGKQSSAFSSFQKMVNGEEMLNAAEQDTIAFLFSETEWWEKKPQTNQAAVAGCHSLLGPASALAGCVSLPAAPWHGARGLHGLRVQLRVPALHHFTQHSVEHPTLPRRPLGARFTLCPWELEVRGGILRPSMRKGRCVSRHDAGSRLSPSIRAPPPSHLHR